MKWAIYLKTDAVLTNNPEKYLALRDAHVPSEKDQPSHWSMREWWKVYVGSWWGVIMTRIRVWQYSGRGGWKERLGSVEETVVKDGISEKIQEVYQ